MPHFRTLMDAIARMEGFYRDNPPSLAKRHKNPGNLRASSLSTEKVNGYCVFPDEETGWRALERQLRLYAKRGLTLGQMVNIYAPASDNNDPGRYLQFLMHKTGATPETPVNDFFESRAD